MEARGRGSGRSLGGSDDGVVGLVPRRGRQVRGGGRLPRPRPRRRPLRRRLTRDDGSAAAGRLTRGGLLAGLVLAVDVLDVERDVEHGAVAADPGMVQPVRQERLAVALDHALGRSRSRSRAREGRVARRLAAQRVPEDGVAAVGGEDGAGVLADLAEAAGDVVLLEAPVTPELLHLLAGGLGELGERLGLAIR